MAARLVRWLCASSLAFFFAQVQAQGRERPFLTQLQLEDPAAVVAWLKKHGASADKQRAAQAHAFGVTEQQRGAIASALKGYGESAIRLPSAPAILTYADLALSYHGELRRARRDHAQYQSIDLRSFESLYRSALASDELMPTLRPEERQRMTAEAACVGIFLRDRTGLQTCAPLQVYGARILSPVRKR